MSGEVKEEMRGSFGRRLFVVLKVIAHFSLLAESRFADLLRPGGVGLLVFPRSQLLQGQQSP